MRTPRLMTVTAALAAVALTLTACGGSALSLDEGWDYRVAEQAAFNLDLEWNPYTKQVETGGGLRLPDAEDDSDWQQALDDAERGQCERYVEEPYGNDVDPLLYQANAVSDVMFSSASAAMPEPSEEYLAAKKRVADEAGEAPNYIGDGEAEWDAYWEMRELLWENELAASPELRDEDAEREQQWEQLTSALSTDANVQRAHELYVNRCGIEVPDGYEFPTMDELGLTPSS